MEKEMYYVEPQVEVVECYVEKGFAESVPIGGAGDPDVKQFTFED